MTVSGGCLCKAVRYSFPDAPLATRICWCRLCQYISGGNGSSVAGFRTEGFAFLGEVRWFESTADSGNHMSRGFCPTCGTQLFSKAESRPHVIFVRAGTLDDPGIAAPQSNIWTSAAPAWACMNPELPRVEGQPAPIK